MPTWAVVSYGNPWIRAGVVGFAPLQLSRETVSGGTTPGDWGTCAAVSVSAAETCGLSPLQLRRTAQGSEELNLTPVQSTERALRLLSAERLGRGGLRLQLACPGCVRSSALPCCGLTVKLLLLKPLVCLLLQKCCVVQQLMIKPNRQPSTARSPLSPVPQHHIDCKYHQGWGLPWAPCARP